MPNSFRLKLLSCSFTLASLLFPALGASQSPLSRSVPMWKEAHRPKTKGTHIPVPQPILDELKADPGDCADPTPGQTTKMDAYRVQNGNETLIAVRGRSTYFCGATGNCEFWVYRSHRGKYEIILTWLTILVFLKTELMDIVTSCFGLTTPPFGLRRGSFNSTGKNTRKLADGRRNISVMNSLEVAGSGTPSQE